ncbi:MAG: His/Gly/Thr/Pro-type tRNA ligase C-terminal domain-containing protein, partial [bacterium]|nr:His/Gly/Thr/Pro-type tRNA ligase C-terminal domain-containing protein [bacterium]
ALPENFGLEYADSDNVFRRPVMIHCAKAGSIERFFGVLVEHYAGAFPLWLAPVQVSVTPVADRHLDYAREVGERLEAAGLRTEVDASSDRLGEKIRRAMTSKHPLVLVVGDQDVENGTVGVRRHGEKRERRAVPLAEVVQSLADEALPPGGLAERRP